MAIELRGVFRDGLVAREDREPRLLRQRRKPAFDGLGLALGAFDDQPFERMWRGELVIARNRPDADCSKAGRQRLVGALALLDLFPPRHDGHTRRLADYPDAVEAHAPTHCNRCGPPFPEDATCELVDEYDENPLANACLHQLRIRPCAPPRRSRHGALSKSPYAWANNRIPD